jgi:hypothetical protein
MAGTMFDNKKDVVNEKKMVRMKEIHASVQQA